MNEGNIRIFGGLTDQVFTAPVGTVYPETLADLGPEYKGLGLLDSKGLEEEADNEYVEVKVHQGYRVARGKITGAKHKFKVICSETNAETFKLRFPASTKATAGGVTVIRDIEKLVRDERQVVIDTFDEDLHTRKIYTRAEVTKRATLSKKANEATLFEFEFTSYGEIIEITNDPALASA